tara:strand:- start:2111 stop:2518 length:408 start_codon:yes stop_codon:yes gene_type:complete
MTWLAVKSATKKVWVWCKRNWKFIVGLAIPLVIGLLARRSFDYNKINERIQEDYRKEINVINESHKIEKENNELAHEKYRDAVKQIEEKFAAEEKELTQAKKKEIKKIIKENIDDPDEITRRLSQITGFEIHNNE